MKKVQNVEGQKESPGYTNNPKREKFNTKNKDKDSDFGYTKNKQKESDFSLEEPRRFINSKKPVNDENKNTQEVKVEEESSKSNYKENEWVAINENHGKGFEQKKYIPKSKI